MTTSLDRIAMPKAPRGYAWLLELNVQRGHGYLWLRKADVLGRPSLKSVHLQSLGDVMHGDEESVAVRIIEAGQRALGALDADPARASYLERLRERLSKRLNIVVRIEDAR